MPPGKASTPRENRQRVSQLISCVIHHYSIAVKSGVSRRISQCLNLVNNILVSEGSSDDDDFEAGFCWTYLRRELP
jgi:hypothetical protein